MQLQMRKDKCDLRSSYYLINVTYVAPVTKLTFGRRVFIIELHAILESMKLCKSNSHGNA